MKSCWIVTRDHKAVLEYREVPVPQPKPGEVIIEVHASALNRGELVVGGAVLAWPDRIAYAELRRLQLAAEGSNTLAVLFRSQRCITEATPAALRLRLDTQGGTLAARILKRRGGVLGRTINLTPSPVVDRSVCFTQPNSNPNGKNNHAVDRPAFPAPAARSLRAGLSIN